jgi:hypothetical protein
VIPESRLSDLARHQEVTQHALIQGNMKFLLGDVPCNSAPKRDKTESQIRRRHIIRRKPFNTIIRSPYLFDFILFLKEDLVMGSHASPLSLAFHYLLGEMNDPVSKG